MTNKYVVSCYSPPAQLKIKSGDIVKIEGWKTGIKIRAESIACGNGPTCSCGHPERKALIGEKIMLKGKAINIKYSKLGVKFDLIDARAPST